MEYLHRFLGKLKDIPDFNFHPKCEKLNLINISITDDLMLFSRGDKTFVQILMEEFRKYYVATALKAHPAKCKLFFGGVQPLVLQEIMQNNDFSQGMLPFKYLGVPVASRKIIVQHCIHLINRIASRIMHWASKLLSYTGRWYLIKSIIMLSLAIGYKFFHFLKR